MLFAGIGVFIAGMNMLSDGLEKSAGKEMKALLGKISDNRFVGVGVGAAVTGIIQSSAATTVMAIGFVNAGVMTLLQATSIIMGANIGTTVTGILVSLKSLPISEFAGAFAFIGVMMGFMKSEKIKRVGGILCGFGLIFIGLDLMGNALDAQEIKDIFINIFQKISFPLLLVLCGMIFTAVIQSSSAATGIFITMVGTGALELDSALFLVLGSNIGTCITAIIVSMGACANAKRTAFIHLTFNVLGTAVFTALIWIFRTFAVQFLQGLVSVPEMQLAWFHVIFNVTTTLLLLPFTKQLVRLAEAAIKDKPSAEENRHLKFVDERILKTPPVAMMQVKKEIEYMSDLARENIQNSFAIVFEDSDAYSEKLNENEAVIDFTNGALSKFLIKLSSLVGAADEKTIGAYFHVLNDLERIGDHAENFHEIGLEVRERGCSFSPEAIAELKAMHGKVMEMFEIASEAFVNGERSRLKELTELENEVDGMKRSLATSHFCRLAEGRCDMTLGAYFISAVSGLERVADHLINFGYSILNPTGSQSQARNEAMI